jgi:hypothetical protein
MRGLLIVSQRVLVALQDLAADDFDSGEVQIRGRSGPGAKLHWIRPRHSTGNYPSQRAVGKPCPACGLPDEFNNGLMAPTIPGAEVVQSFGDSTANLARIGKFPQLAERDPSEPLVRHDLAVSGGLFATLFNMGFKGLAWPAWGPLVSLQPQDATWEATRRLADRTSSKEDKIMKKKAPDWPD